MMTTPVLVNEVKKQLQIKTKGKSHMTKPMSLFPCHVVLYLLWFTAVLLHEISLSPPQQIPTNNFVSINTCAILAYSKLQLTDLKVRISQQITGPSFHLYVANFMTLYQWRMIG
jgi:hypothetical protein